jgi:hypothetical protein
MRIGAEEESKKRKKGSQPSFPQCMRHDYDCLKKACTFISSGLADAEFV